MTKISYKVLLALVIILLGVIIYILLQNTYQQDSQQEYLLRQVNEEMVYQDEPNNRVIDNEQIKKEIIFNTNFLTVDSQSENMLENNFSVEEESSREGYNAPAYSSYNLSNVGNDKIALKYNFIQLNIFHLSRNNYQNKKGLYWTPLNNIQNILTRKSSLSSFENSNELMVGSDMAICTEPTHIKFIKTEFLSGFRFITHCAQEYAPWESVEYVFSGLSNDGLNHIVLSYDNILARSLENYFNDNAGSRMDTSDNNINKTIQIVEKESDDGFSPSLLQIDNFVKSIQYK